MGVGRWKTDYNLSSTVFMPLKIFGKPKFSNCHGPVVLTLWHTSRIWPTGLCHPAQREPKGQITSVYGIITWPDWACGTRPACRITPADRTHVLTLPVEFGQQIDLVQKLALCHFSGPWDQKVEHNSYSSKGVNLTSFWHGVRMIEKGLAV